MACYDPDDTKVKEWISMHILEIERTRDAGGIPSTHGLSCGDRFHSVMPGSRAFTKSIFTSCEEIPLNKWA